MLQSRVLEFSSFNQGFGSKKPKKIEESKFVEKVTKRWIPVGSSSTKTSSPRTDVPEDAGKTSVPKQILLPVGVEIKKKDLLSPRKP